MRGGGLKIYDAPSCPNWINLYQANVRSAREWWRVSGDIAFDLRFQNENQRTTHEISAKLAANNLNDANNLLAECYGADWESDEKRAAESGWSWSGSNGKPIETAKKTELTSSS